MTNHNNIELGELITLKDLAAIVNVSASSLRSHCLKLDLPEAISIGNKKHYRKQQINDYLKTNNLAEKLAKVRNQVYLEKTKSISTKPNSTLVRKTKLPLINRFLRGEYDPNTKKQARQLKFAASKPSNAQRVILKCYVDVYGNVSRKFL